MSQAQDELVARATDPNAELSTLHELAQNYPGLRPYIAANPRTYPALLDWLGSLGDADVSAVLASRTQAGTDAALETARRLRGRDPQATQAFPGGLPPVDPAATAAMPAAEAAQPQYQQTQYQQPQYQQPAQPQFQTAQQPTQSAAEETLFGVGTPEREAERRSSTWLWVLGAIAVVAVVALVVWFLSSSHGGSDPSGTTATQGTVSTQAGPVTSVPTAEASESASPTASATPDETIKYPAPNDADEMSAFTAPSGNITCRLGEDSVSCSINEHSFVPTDGSCDNSADKPFTVSVGKDSGASGNCESGYSTSGATLNYGSSAKNGTFACTSSESGIECWNQITGKGFTVSRTEAKPTSR
ncbi:variant leucine-rich repeat-containing protein [Actinomyces haliotis]|uniref:variant leucine-rich repeat-containing protein n=1 Tax=Actinomyces haliotis TaxID=1280843 RepID=UPI00188F321E|nr:hypothetical protein [Actinomyces haliotis]